MQQFIVPRMLTRSKRNSKKRSAILTLKTQANAIFENSIAKTLQFPVLKSAMAFNAALAAALREHYSDKGIDVM